VKGVGSGAFEYKIDFGPGHRVYFGKDGDRLMILVGGDRKSASRKDIAAAKERWADYKLRKKKQEMK
jgi:putative addiction module killer protein